MSAPLPQNPINDAHNTMIFRLAALIPPRIYVNPDPCEFENTADYLCDVARIVDQWLLAVGREVNSNTSVRIDMSLFTDQVLGAVEGNATYECTRAAEALAEDLVAAE